ncbi:MAG: response regulator [Acidobacteria bacterium]|nr:response regulator [Acidobacteriota bacterium]
MTRIGAAGHRILIVDDNEAIHHDLRKILAPSTRLEQTMDEEEEILFGSRAPQVSQFEIGSAFQGQEALAMLRKAVREARPYSLAFVDVRMPPGWDGVETTRRLWEVDPHLQVVLCTAYTDYSWNEILEQLGESHNFVILKKPFETIEVTQLAHALTSKREAMECARAHTFELETEVHQRRQTERDLVTALDAAEEANRCKRDFLSNMSHEFRTPLNAILGYVDMIAEDARHSSAAASLMPMLDKVQLAGRHLLELINDILDMSRIESGRMNLQPSRICVETIAREAVALATPLAAKRGNSLTFHQDPAASWIEADETRFRQCLLNLLGNACKFTSSGVVSLDVRKFSSPDKDWIDWTVRDTGIGIAPHQIPRLFQPFNQVDSAITRKYGGTGLGLAISQRLCSMMGGAISVESRLGEGSAFTIRIPASPSSKEPSHVRT